LRSSTSQEGRVYELAGDPALSYPEIAARIGGLLEREVDYIDQTVEEREAPFTRAVPAAPNIFPYSRAGAIAEA
jgi:NAD(P)H dehydrogenase (quinone)